MATVQDVQRFILILQTGAQTLDSLLRLQSTQPGGDYAEQNEKTIQLVRDAINTPVPSQGTTGTQGQPGPTGA